MREYLREPGAPAASVGWTRVRQGAAGAAAA